MRNRNTPIYVAMGLSVLGFFLLRSMLPEHSPHGGTHGSYTHTAHSAAEAHTSESASVSTSTAGEDEAAAAAEEEELRRERARVEEEKRRAVRFPSRVFCNEWDVTPGTLSIGDVTFVVLTQQPFLRNALVAKWTWYRHVVSGALYSSEHNKWLPVVQVPAGEADEVDAKTEILGLKHALETAPDAKWYFVVCDNTFVDVNALLRVLSEQPTDEGALWLGWEATRTTEAAAPLAYTSPDVGYAINHDMRVELLPKLKALTRRWPRRLDTVPGVQVSTLLRTLGHSVTPLPRFQRDKGAALTVPSLLSKQMLAIDQQTTTARLSEWNEEHGNVLGAEISEMIAHHYNLLLRIIGKVQLGPTESGYSDAMLTLQNDWDVLHADCMQQLAAFSSTAEEEQRLADDTDVDVVITAREE